MDNITDPVRVLSDAQCWERLATQELGRFVTGVRDRIEIFPVNYIVDDESILFRTAPGVKQFMSTVNPEVVFEVDDHAPSEAWSVIVRGRARTLDTFAEVERADALGLRPWIPTLKYTWIRIEPATVSGRAFTPGPEPDRYGTQQY